MSRGFVGRALACLGALVVGVAGWFDWVEIGARRRSSYAMFRSLQNLGLGELDPVRVVWWWMPVLAAACALAVVAGRVRLAAALGVVVGVVVGGSALVVAISGMVGGVGPWLGLLGTVVLWGGLVTRVQVRS